MARVAQAIPLTSASHSVTGVLRRTRRTLRDIILRGQLGPTEISDPRRDRGPEPGDGPILRGNFGIREYSVEDPRHRVM